ncbi:MAG TPA: PVC-type heme-binding CxxCH protein, partial [Planctomycetaceae bacterium]|nr:PVC-type heme-binding CxxCH protein [Planctomycetaceae bacterium]
PRLSSRTFWLSGLFLCLFSTQAFAAEDWTILQVPGVWDEQSNGEFANYDGIAWYRCFVKVPANWKGAKLTLTTQGIDNAYEAYFNGLKVGAEGTFPPKYTSGLNAVPKKWAVAVDNVHAGAFNEVAIRVYDHDGRGGFKGAAPILSKDVEAIELKGSWQFRTGDDLAWSKLPEAIPSTARFEKVEDLAGIAARNFKAPDDVKPLSVEVAQQKFQIADGLEWTPVLSEPEIAQPVHMSFDERGRMWVIEYRQYPDPAGLTVVSRDTFWRVVYDKVPPAPPNHDRGRDRISIHEDTDGDGTYDSHKVFLDGMNIVTSCARGRGGVWVLNPPYLLFYADRNNDDVPDGDPEVHLSGFGLEDTHSCASNLMWGPDGWLYAAQGSTVSGHIMRPGDKTAVHSMGQLIWRYHPEKKIYEIFAEGGGNAWGLEIDAKGRVFSGHNGGDTRGFHYVQGGYSQKGFGKHGPLSNPYSFGYFPPMKHPSVPRFTHAFVIYEGASLPEAHWGKLFGVAPLQGHVVESDFFPDGTTFQTKDIGHPVTTTDSWFRPVNIKVGPDGAIYVADM